MELENIVLNEILQTQMDMHGMYSPIRCVLSKQVQNTWDTIELKKVNKLKHPSEDAPISLGREKKTITGTRDTWVGGRGEGKRET